MVPMVALLASCGSNPAPPGPAPRALYCGSATGHADPVRFELPAEVSDVAPPDCFQVRVEGGDAGPAVLWYHAAFSGGGCLFHGTDADGLANGLSATLDGGECSYPDTFGAAVAGSAERFRLLEGTLGQFDLDGVTAWSLRARVAIDQYIAPEGAERYGTLSRHLRGALNHDGAPAREAPPFPTESWEGTCDTPCVRAELGPGVVEFAEIEGHCEVALEDIGAPPTVRYDFDEEGHNRLPDGSLEGPYMRIPGTCLHVFPTATHWLTWVDFDAGVTDVTAVVRKDVGGIFGLCRIRYSGTLEPASCD